jgi:hypothetical protein
MKLVRRALLATLIASPARADSRLRDLARRAAIYHPAVRDVQAPPSRHRRARRKAQSSAFASVFLRASRHTGGDAPPPWKGDLSSEVVPIYAPAPSMWLRLRIAATNDDEDVDVAAACRRARFSKRRINGMSGESWRCVN